MGALAQISIDLAKLDKSKIVEGKNGQKYYNLTININDATDNYGNNVSVTEPQTKEQRDSKEPKTYFGNGKVFWTDGNINKAEPKDGTVSAPVSKSNEPDDLPF